MKKGINLQAQVHLDADAGAADALRESLAATFARVNPGMQLKIKGLSAPDAHGNATARVYIEAEQDPATPFAPVATDALHKAVEALPMDVAVRGLEEHEDDDEDGELVLPPGQAATPPAAAVAAASASAPTAAPGASSEPAAADSPIASTQAGEHAAGTATSATADRPATSPPAAAAAKKPPDASPPAGDSTVPPAVAAAAKTEPGTANDATPAAHGESPAEARALTRPTSPTRKGKSSRNRTRKRKR
ncbi:MAG TPA: hypothetical protein VM536_22765 [Chloroflexia bacterium]|nr:hypothetical protein [Chloroflexia bacterium]